jgi:hypothetical protein
MPSTMLDCARNGERVSFYNHASSVKLQGVSAKYPWLAGSITKLYEGRRIQCRLLSLDLLNICVTDYNTVNSNNNC